MRSSCASRLPRGTCRVPMRGGENLVETKCLGVFVVNVMSPVHGLRRTERRKGWIGFTDSANRTRPLLLTADRIRSATLANRLHPVKKGRRRVPPRASLAPKGEGTGHREPSLRSRRSIHRTQEKETL
ncbi:hypothetical protein D9M71_631520 [compost metagenome]